MNGILLGIIGGLIALIGIIVIFNQEKHSAEHKKWFFLLDLINIIYLL